MTAANGDVAAIRSGLESQLIVHDEQIVFQGDDEAQFTVIQADVSVDAPDEAPVSTTHPILFAQVRGGQPSAVCIAVRPDGRLLLVRHWRIATDSFEWEFPRSMGEAGEVAGRTAERELEAEAGLTSSGRRLLQMIHADTCKLRDSVAVVEVYVDDDQSAPIADEAAQQDDAEESRLAWMTVDEIDQMIAEGNIMDGITLAAYLIWKTQRDADHAVDEESV